MKPRLFSGLLLLGLCAGVAAAAEPHALLEATTAKVVAEGEAMGVSGMVAIDGAASASAAGWRSARDRRPPQAEDLFEIGSVSKVFTTLLLAEMALRGEVALEAPAQRYLDGLTTLPTGSGGSVITLEHLATHSSGLPRLPGGMTGDLVTHPEDPYAAFSETELLGWLPEAELQSEPGEVCTYSNLGVGLLGDILAYAAGPEEGEIAARYEALLRERVLEPLELSETGIAYAADQRERLIQGHTRGVMRMPFGSRFSPVGPWTMPALAGAGGLHGTIGDLLAFGEAAARADADPAGATLGEAFALAMTPRRQFDAQARIGLGWLTTPLRGAAGESAGAQAVWHNGATGGYGAFVGFVRWPASAADSADDSMSANPEIVVALLANTGGGGVTDAGLDLLGQLAAEALDGSPITHP